MKVITDYCITHDMHYSGGSVCSMCYSKYNEDKIMTDKDIVKSLKKKVEEISYLLRVAKQSNLTVELLLCDQEIGIKHIIKVLA